MRCSFIDEAKTRVPVQRLSKVLNVSPSGDFAWKGQHASRCQREDLILPAHVRSAYSLSHESYGSPRMTHELSQQGLEAERRVGRLMQENGLGARQPRRSTDSQYACPVASNRLDHDVTAAAS